MSAPSKHPIGDLLATAEETARIMWRSYDDHLSHPRANPEWEKRAWVIYHRCMACSAHVWRLKELRNRAFPPQEDAENVAF